MAQQFDTTFPHLSGIGFSDCWGSDIDTCIRLFAFHGLDRDGPGFDS